LLLEDIVRFITPPRAGLPLLRAAQGDDERGFY
jgi:hypothetical protein